MATAKKIDLGMTNFDELFMTDAERKEVKLPRIYDIPIAEIDDFPNHPYEVKDDEDMQFLVENVKERGIITPATVRKKEDGRYEMISGHRRKRACELAGLETLRCDVVELDRDEAIILMVDSNLQRSDFLPMEKARAYQMKMEALKHQGKATTTVLMRSNTTENICFLSCPTPKNSTSISEWKTFSPKTKKQTNIWASAAIPLK